eukprot:scaffold2068_cov226-Pinguiococcus_pyrenoidosus.AAC.2
MTAHWDAVGWPAGFDTEEQRTTLVKGLHQRKTELFMDMLRRGEIPLRPGVEALIGEALEAGLKVAVCSTSNEKAVATLVETLLTPYASRIPIYAGDMVQKKKPAPDVYNMAAQELEVDPRDCMVSEAGCGGGIFPFFFSSCSSCLLVCLPWLGFSRLHSAAVAKVFEDTAIGLQAASAANMACTVTKSIYTEHEDFTGARRWGCFVFFL